MAFLDGLAERPVVPAWQPPPEASLPERGTGLRGVPAEFGDGWEPGLSVSAGPRYLGPSGAEPDLIRLTPEHSRRLRALAAWFTLRAYGRDGYRESVERCVAGARSLGRAVAEAPELRLPAPVRRNVACFPLSGEPTVERLRAFADEVAPEVFVTPATHDGTPAPRAAGRGPRSASGAPRRRTSPAPRPR